MTIENLYWLKTFSENPFPCVVFSRERQIIDANPAARRAMLHIGEKAFLSELIAAVGEERVRLFISADSPTSRHFFFTWENKSFVGQLLGLGGDIVLVATPHIEAPEAKNTQKVKDLLEDILISLRNPLAIVQGRVDLMDLIVKESNIKHYLGNIAEQCQRISSILDVAQILSVRSLRRTEFKLQAVVQECLNTAGLSMENLDELDVSIQNDQERIKMIIFSLLNVIRQFGALKDIRLRKIRKGYELYFHADISRDGFNILYDVTTGSIRQKRDGNNYQLYGLQIALESCGLTLDFTEQQIVLCFIEEKEDPETKKNTILLVDDDQMLRETLVELLSFDGYHIITANSAEEALQQLDREIDVILMDVRLPGISGIEFLAEIEHSHPHLVERMILISGLEISNPKNIPFLQKPFSRAVLTQTIAAVLSQDLNASER